MKKTTWRLDLDTAHWIIDNAEQIYKDTGEFNFPITTCPHCGADYYEILGHTCGNYHDFICDKCTTPDGWDVIDGIVGKENEPCITKQ